MRPYSIQLRTGQRVTIDLDHLVAIEGPFLDTAGVSCKLHFLFKDEPLTVFGGYYKESEYEFSQGRSKLRKPGGELIDHHDPEALNSLAAMNFRHGVMDLIEKAWIEG